MTAPSPARRRNPRYWRRLFAVLVAAILIAAAGVPALLGAATTYSLLYGPCNERAATPTDFGYAWEDVTLAAQDGSHIRAYFIPGSSAATPRSAAIIIPPTTNAGRANRLGLAAMLAGHGYAVLTFESRRCAGMGPLSLGYHETREVGIALAYLQTRDDVDPDRIGITGFSSAGATTIMAAAQYPALRAVIAEGGYGDFADGVIGANSDSGTILEAIYKWSIAGSYRVITGVSLDNLSPLDVIGSIAPRPILLIYGSRESSLAGAKQQVAAAGPTADLWIVNGAGHGRYREVAPDEYERRVVAFFDSALQGE